MLDYKKILCMMTAIAIVSVPTALAGVSIWSDPIADNLWDKFYRGDVPDVAYFNEAGSPYVAVIDTASYDTVYVIDGNETEYWENSSVFGYSIAAGDVDDDGKNEVIVGGHNDVKIKDGITVFEDDGTFKFFYETNSRFVKDIEIGDIDGDNINDIVACNNYNGAKVYVINGTNGNDTNGWPRDFNDESIQDIALGNLDGAGGKDVAIISDSISSTLYVYNSTGFELWFNDSVRGRSVEIGNVDNDSENEVVIGDQESDYVYVYNGSKDELKYAFNTSQPPSEIELGDLDDDGKDEIAVITAYTRDRTLFAIDINATNQANEMWRYEIKWTPDYYGEGLAIGDVDRDYKNEVIAASDTHNVYAFDGIDNDHNGAGDVVWKYGPGNDIRFDTEINEVEVGDVDGDGDMDVIVGTDYVENPTVWILSTQEHTLQVNGNNISFDSDPSNITSLANPPLPPNPPAGYNFPYGVFSINITLPVNGSTAIITITLPDNLPAGSVYWKYSPNGNGSPTNLPGWYQVPLGDNDGDNVITITLQDGGIGDADGIANGVIVDQGGPALPYYVKVPALTPIGMMALAGLVSIVAVMSIRKKKI